MHQWNGCFNFLLNMYSSNIHDINIFESDRTLTVKEPGYFDQSHSRRGRIPPLKISETDRWNIKCVVLFDSYDPPESIDTTKFKTYLVWRHSDVISDVMSKTRKSPKIAKIMVFRYFFKQKVHILAMMCVKVCLHMFLLQINQINKIKHSGSVSWKTKKTKTRFVCNFNGKSVFLCTQRAITHRRVITLGPIFFIKMVINQAQGLKKKSQEVSARKNNNRQRNNKKCRRETAPPALLGLKIYDLFSPFKKMICP